MVLGLGFLECLLPRGARQAQGSRQPTRTLPPTAHSASQRAYAQPSSSRPPQPHTTDSRRAMVVLNEKETQIQQPVHPLHSPPPYAPTQDIQQQYLLHLQQQQRQQQQVRRRNLSTADCLADRARRHRRNSSSFSNRSRHCTPGPPARRPGHPPRHSRRPSPRRRTAPSSS